MAGKPQLRLLPPNRHVFALLPFCYFSLNHTKNNLRCAKQMGNTWSEAFSAVTVAALAAWLTGRASKRWTLSKGHLRLPLCVACDHLPESIGHLARTQATRQLVEGYATTHNHIKALCQFRSDQKSTLRKVLDPKQWRALIEVRLRSHAFDDDFETTLAESFTC